MDTPPGDETGRPRAEAIVWQDRLLRRWFQRGWRGFLTLRRVLPRSGSSDGIAFRTPYGSIFQLNPSEYIDAIVLREGFYESEVLQTLLDGMGTDAVVWDIGANFGLHAVTLARLVPTATVVAFEPHPLIHARLLAHRARNRTAFIASTLALSDQTAATALHPGPAGNSGMTSLQSTGLRGMEETILIAATTGDALVRDGQLPAPTALKLDVEGHEARVLSGMSSLLASPRCTLVVFEDSYDPETPAKVLLRKAGFSLAPLLRREASSHPLGNFAARKA